MPPKKFKFIYFILLIFLFLLLIYQTTILPVLAAKAAENLIVNNQHNIMNPNDAESGGAKRAGANNIKSFSEFLEFEYEKMVVHLPVETIPVHCENCVHKYRNKVLMEELKNRKTA